MIKQLVKQKLGGRTQRWLGSQMGITDVMLSESINGFRKFKSEELSKLMEVLDISEAEISAYPTLHTIYLQSLQKKESNE